MGSYCGNSKKLKFCLSFAFINESFIITSQRLSATALIDFMSKRFSADEHFNNKKV